MVSAPTDRITIELGPAEKVHADLFVVPSTTRGGFGLPWRLIVERLGASGPAGSIALGDVALREVPTAGRPVRFLGFAATVDPSSPTTGAVIESVGRRLGELTASNHSLLDVATPSLGTGVGNLDPVVSLEALVSGFLQTAHPAARLRILEVDREKYDRLSGALAARTARDVDGAHADPDAHPASNEPDETDRSTPSWAELSAGAQHAFALADAYRRHARSSSLHMEQLVAALFRSDDPSVRARFGRVDEATIVELAARARTTIPPSVTVTTLHGLPSLSTHVQDVVGAARRRAGAGRPVTETHLIAAALATSCSYVVALRERIGSRGALLANPAGDTVPDTKVGSADRLDLRREVEMLATVALEEKAPLPLAIGLFGDWGSGKSFFMAMLRERMNELADQARAGTPEAAPFCRNIRQIQFNAWHYIDGNLWASLASAIFDGLVDSPGDEVKKSKADGLGRATQAAIAAKDAVLEAESELRSAQQRASSPMAIARSAVPAAIEAIRDVPDLEQRLKTFDAHGDAEPSTTNLLDAVRVTTSFTGKVGLFRRLIAVELTSRRRRATLIWLGTVVAVLLGVWALSEQGRPSAAATVIALLTSLTPALAGATRILSLSRSAREKREQPVVDAEARLAQARHEERLADDELAARVQDLERLRNRGQQLHDLVRSARSEYGSRLSMMSQLRKDFEQLTRLLQSDDVPTDRDDALRAAATQLCRDGNSGSVDSLDVERIILYIDDLDRCPAKDVVDVLQAVNLLLTFKLFVVVIGVDGRWLEASLRSRYDTLLDSPQDYLEKIIQLPFVLRPISPDGYSSLIDALAPGPLPAASAAPPEAVRSSDGDPGAGLDQSTAPSPPEPPEDTPSPELPEPAGVAAPRPELLVITDEERAALRRTGDVITNPRTTKRLVNTYRMLRVCAGEDEDDRFSPTGGGEYKAVIVLLAVLIGCPAQATSFFSCVMAADPAEDMWQLLEREGKAGRVDLGRVSSLEPLVARTSAEAFQHWVPFVSRFTYRLDSVVAATPGSA